MWKKYPVIRGMLSYALMYPGANVFQQVAFRHHQDGENVNLKKLKDISYINKRLEKVDWSESTRFMLYGGLFHAPLVHNWMHLVQKLFPGTSTRQILKKVQISSCVIYRSAWMLLNITKYRMGIIYTMIQILYFRLSVINLSLRRWLSLVSLLVCQYWSWKVAQKYMTNGGIKCLKLGW